jgi:superfamily I DNA/RNA helicase
VKVLRRVAPTPEQLKVINDYKAGTTLIRGAAGSGKTTTALLRLSFLVNRWKARRTRLRLQDPVRVLVLTFNRTLRGYITELVNEQVQVDANEVVLTVETFGKWSKDLSGTSRVFDGPNRDRLIGQLGARIDLPSHYIAEEVGHILGRYLPGSLQNYLTDRREGRGNVPRVDQALRQRLLDEVITPYSAHLSVNGLVDWNDMAVDLATHLRDKPYDVVIVDEAQDFSANQVRAITHHLADDHSVTYILDAAQRIYPRFFTWKEVGLAIAQNASFRLSKNHRNTKQIAAFAKQVIEKLDLTDDGTLPDLDSCSREGPMPKMLVGRFSQQMAYAADYIARYVDLRVDSVAFLHPKGGGWFDHVRATLTSVGLPFQDITREADWPSGNENIALSTLHSAKGLEFDHVIMLGLNAEVLPQKENQDGEFETLQRLFAMAVGRAKTTLLLGYRADDAPELLKVISKKTFELVKF